LFLSSLICFNVLQVSFLLSWTFITDWNVLIFLKRFLHSDPTPSTSQHAQRNIYERAHTSLLQTSNDTVIPLVFLQPTTFNVTENYIGVSQVQSRKYWIN
jgi:hypothetical protein